MRANQPWVALLVLLALVGATACTPRPARTGETLAPDGQGPLRIALLPLTDVIPFYVAQAEGFFEAEGVQVALLPVASAAERDRLIESGEADGQLNDLVSTVLTNAGGAAQVRVVRQSRIPYPERPQFYILAAPASGLADLDALKGRTIGISERTVIAYVTDRMLQMQEFEEGDIVTRPIPDIQARYEALIGQQVAAATLPDPLASLAVMQGATVLLTDADTPHVSQSVVSFRAEVLASRPAEVAAAMRAYDRAVRAINADPDAYQNILIANSRVPEPLQDRYRLPHFPEGTLTSQSEFDDVVQWALDKGLIAAPIPYRDLIDPTFLYSP